MKKSSHFLKQKLKNAMDNGSSINTFKKDLNYVSNVLNSVVSSFRKENKKNFENENNFCENEASALSNFKFLKINNKVRNSINSVSNSPLSKNRNANSLLKYSVCSSKINSNIKEFLSSLENNIKTKRQKFLDVKQSKMGVPFSELSKTPKAKNSNFNIYENNGKGKQNRPSLFLNYTKEYNNFLNYNPISTNNQILSSTNINQYDYYNDNKKVFKINENITKEFESKELKKKVNLMKKTLIQNSSNQDLEKLLAEDEKIITKLKKSEIKKNNDEIIEEIIGKNKKEIEENSQISLKSNSENKEEKFRNIKRIKEIFDSFDDEEYEDDTEADYYISPSCYFVKIFDSMMFFSSMFYLIYVPYYFSQNIILKGENKFALIILTIIDAIYIVDIIINFFRAYQNFDESLVRKTKFIFLHYLKTWFLFDLIQAFPFFTIFKFIERNCINHNLCTSDGYSPNKVNQRAYFLILIKILKAYKMLKHNDTLSSFGEVISENEFIDNYGYMIFSAFYSLCFLNLCTCLYIYIGKNTFPGWILKINIMDESYINIYVASTYFILVTITTVGYGDITGDSYLEIIFQMILLIVGTLAYSFVISYISNYIVKKNQKSLAFEKNLNILKEIKMENPNLKDSVYHECIKNLFNEQLYERKDKSMLFDCLPYSLKNKLIMEMYKPFVKNFIFFKHIENSDFIAKVVTSLKPLLSFKENILIQEGDFIKEIFFVKKGALSLNICYDKENIEESISKFIGVNEFGKIKITFMPAPMLNNTQEKDLDIDIDNYLMSKKTIKNNKHNSMDIQEIKIIEIRKNEHFGDALMFLNERSPLVVKVKSKIAELLVLRKMEAIEIYSIYPIIWKRINKKSLFNMEQIKMKIKNGLFFIAKKYGSEAKRNILEKSKSLNRFMNLKSFIENESPQSGKNEANNKKQKKRKKNSRNNNKLKYSNINLPIIEVKEENSPQKTKIEEKVENKVNDNNSNTMNENNSNSKKYSKNIFNFNSTEKNNNILKENENIVKSGYQIKIDYKSEIDNEESTSSKKKEKKSSDMKSSSDISSSNSTEKKKIAIINNDTPEDNDDNNNDNKKINKKIVKHISMPINFDINTVRNSNIPQNISLSNIKNRQSLTIKSENLFYPSFSNLSTTNEKSFELISSYENINKITNNIYIKNLSLQSKTKKFLINECSSLSNHSPNEKVRISKNLNGKIIIKKRNSKKNLTSDSKIDKDYKYNSVNSLDGAKLPSKKNIGKFDDLTYINNKAENKNRMQESIRNSIGKRQSHKNVMVLISNKTLKPNTKKRMQSLKNVNAKLNLISKNIQGANKNINNPEEFYMDFFNNIIKQETGVKQKSEDKSNNNKKTSENKPDKAQKKDLSTSEKNSPNNKYNNSIIDDMRYRKPRFQRKTMKFNCQYQS